MNKNNCPTTRKQQLSISNFTDANISLVTNVSNIQVTQELLPKC
jgi:hypothetical protein